MQKTAEDREISRLLESVRPEVDRKSNCLPAKEGVFRAVLKSAFARTYAYAEFVHAKNPDSGPQRFFGSAALRQCCEDFIALKFLVKLKRRDKDAVIGALMVLGTSKASEKQRSFFNQNHPYQPIIRSTFSQNQVQDAKLRLNEVGARTGLWKTKDKLPPIEQMAMNAGLSELYDYLYAATSEIVHFNVRIALRSGWGDTRKQAFHFSPANFARFYAEFSRVYAAYIWVKFCRVFRSSLGLSAGFMTAVDGIELLLESIPRWPELVTFEEMNIPLPSNVILLGFLDMMQSKRVDKLRKHHKNRLARRNSTALKLPRGRRE